MVTLHDGPIAVQFDPAPAGADEAPEPADEAYYPGADEAAWWAAECDRIEAVRLGLSGWEDFDLTGDYLGLDERSQAWEARR